MTIVIYAKPRRFPCYDCLFNCYYFTFSPCHQDAKLKKDFCFHTKPRVRSEGHANIAKRMLGTRNLQSRSNHFNFRETYAGDRWPGGLASLRTSLNVKAKTASPRHESNPGRRGVTIAAQEENSAPTGMLTMTYLDGILTMTLRTPT